MSDNLWIDPKPKREFTPAQIGPDHTPDDQVPALLPIKPPGEGEPDPSINPPPKPEPEPTDPVAAHIHLILSSITAAIEGLADRVPGAHDFSRRLQPVKASLETLWAMAHNPK